MDLRSLRKEKGYTIQQVSDGTGLPPTSLKYWEKGERQPAADVLPKLAEFYGITTDKLLGYKAPNLPALEEPEEVFEESRQGAYGLWADELIVPDSKVESALFAEYDKVTKSFFKMGYYLTLINKYHIYERQGYANITEYSEDKLGIGSTTTYNFMKVYNMTSKSFAEPLKMDERYLPYDQSKLVELSRSKWAVDNLIQIVKPTDTVKEIQAYVSLWNNSYDKRGVCPEGKTVKEALAIAAEEKAAKEKAKALPQPSETIDDVPPGQLSIFGEDEENERPFDESSEEPQEETEDDFEEVGESYSTPGVSMAFVDMSEESEKKGYVAPAIEIVSDKLTLKNDTERKEFLKQAENFNISVLKNEELGLEITKRVLRNGATIYRTTYKYLPYGSRELEQFAVLCLVDPQEEVFSHWSSTPEKPYMSYTLSGTAETYIVQYLSKYKDEI